MASWLDFLPFDEEVSVDVQRYKWNTHGILPFFGEEACGFPVEPISYVKEGEQSVTMEDHGFWMNEWDITELKAYFRVLFPGFRAAVGERDEEVDTCFGMLTKIMGGEGVKKKFTWPCVLVLGTRR